MKPRVSETGLGIAHPDPTGLTDEQRQVLNDRRSDIEKILRTFTTQPNLIDEILQNYGLMEPQS